MSPRQRTIADAFTVEGKGLHSGCTVSMTVKPAGAGEGIVFKRIDLAGAPTVRVSPANVGQSSQRGRCTTLGRGDCFLHTVEHFLSALCGLGITNLLIEIDAEELPGLDGSAQPFIEHLSRARVIDQDQETEVYKITAPLGVAENGSSIYVVPGNEYRISYTLNYDHPFLGSQFFEAVLTEDGFRKHIAPCRTFCLEQEAEELRKQGFGKGANYSNTLVVGEKGVIENETRFPDEFARHKVLDLIGDLYLLGVPIRGHIFAVRSGHELNLRLLRKIAEQRDEFLVRKTREVMSYEGKQTFEIRDIMNILPHRYPFLLVDRVIEVESGQKGIGIKNVTINDNFFQGHFPSRPVMPGVMMVEAMAQTGGVIVLTSKKHRGKLAFFMAADNVKFRKVVSPGDQLIMEVEVIRDRSRTAQVRGRATVDGEVVAEADMVFSFTQSTYLDEN